MTQSLNLLLTMMKNLAPSGTEKQNHPRGANPRLRDSNLRRVITCIQPYIPKDHLHRFITEFNWRYVAPAEAAEAEAEEADWRNNDAEVVFTAKLTNGLAGVSSSARLGKRERHLAIFAASVLV